MDDIITWVQIDNTYCYLITMLKDISTATSSLRAYIILHAIFLECDQHY